MHMSLGPEKEKLLQHEYLVANFGVDTAEEGPSKVWVTNLPSGLRPSRPGPESSTGAEPVRWARRARSTASTQQLSSDPCFRIAASGLSFKIIVG